MYAWIKENGYNRRSPIVVTEMTQEEVEQQFTVAERAELDSNDPEWWGLWEQECFDKTDSDHLETIPKHRAIVKKYWWVIDGNHRSVLAHEQCSRAPTCFHVASHADSVSRHVHCVLRQTPGVQEDRRGV
jgi:hypothetical protein